ncbi:hypothetical protein F5X68DRAFT_189840 [Plectosphaerella plurivora]|uniref:Uncharacterized protein n=1 Tax=Plectosphaerella plurivora TaxID=936078 RepID=A0A9P8VDQ7_9PEZI|nr:hypothetical protein F5X68DRAFT_189840 [Plectosphaerella plurivora]
MRFPWSKKPSKGQQVTLNAVSSSGPIICHGHQEVVAWLAGQSSPDALASVIAQQERSPKKHVRKIAPPAIGTEAVNGWPVSQSQMCLDEILDVRDRVSTDATRRDSMDLTVLSPRVSVSSQTSFGAEVRSYLLGISTAAEASLEASPEAWNVEDEDSCPASPAETVDEKYLALALSTDLVEASSSRPWTEYSIGDDEEEEEDDDIPWASDALRESIGSILPLASVSPRKAIVVDRPTPMETEHPNLPICVGQPMRPQTITISGTSLSFPSPPGKADAEYQAQEDYNLPIHPALRDLHFGFQTPDTWDDGWVEHHHELPIPVKVTPPSPADPEPPVSHPPTAEVKGKYLAVPEVDTISEPLVDTESVIDYCFDSTQDLASDSDSGRESIGNFNYEVEDSSDDETTYHLLSQAAVPHLEAVKKHLSLPAETLPRQVQMYLSRNVEIIRATVLGIVCNPRFLDNHDREVSITPALKHHHRQFVTSLCKIDWDTDLAHGGLVPACIGALVEEETFVTERMKKRSAKHLVIDRDMSWSQLSRFLQVADYHGDLADQYKLVRSGRVEEFIDLVRQGVLSNEDGLFSLRGGLKHAMGLKEPLMGMERIRWKQNRGPQASPLGFVTNMSDWEYDEETDGEVNTEVDEKAEDV